MHTTVDTLRARLPRQYRSSSCAHFIIFLSFFFVDAKHGLCVYKSTAVVEDEICQKKNAEIQSAGEEHVRKVYEHHKKQGTDQFDQKMVLHEQN